MPTISFVLPVKDEEEVLPELHPSLHIRVWQRSAPG
jgi:hypothetical protein